MYARSRRGNAWGCSKARSIRKTVVPLRVCCGHLNCTHFVPSMARNALWLCTPFLWHAAWRERGVKTCFRYVRALYTHFYAQFTQCANKMTAMDTQWNDLETEDRSCKRILAVEADLRTMNLGLLCPRIDVPVTD